MGTHSRSIQVFVDPWELRGPCKSKHAIVAESTTLMRISVMLTPTIAGDAMPYWERVRNVGFRILDWHFGGQLSDQIDHMYREKYGADFPGVNKLVANISLAFINANPFFDLPRPISHKTVYVGGIVEKKPSPLSPVSNGWG